MDKNLSLHQKSGESIDDQFSLPDWPSNGSGFWERREVLEMEMTGEEKKLAAKHGRFQMDL